MATQYYWLGAAGPFPYEDGAGALDPSHCNDANDYSGIAVAGQFPLSAMLTTGQINVQTAPTDATHVLREDDIGGIVGDVVGPGSSTDNEVPRFDGATGKILQSDATSPMLVDDNAHITQFGGNIKFPAVQAASADVNTLDDYEEGSWTPSIAIATPGTSAVSGQVGRYTKIGNLVTCNGSLTFTKGTGTGILGSISGLPFAANATAGLYQPCSFHAYGVGRAGHYVVNGNVSPGGTTIGMGMAPQGTGAHVNVLDTDMAATIYLRVSVTYQV